jgi:hypothetical protein
VVELHFKPEQFNHLVSDLLDYIHNLDFDPSLDFDLIGCSHNHLGRYIKHSLGRLSIMQSCLLLHIDRNWRYHNFNFFGSLNFSNFGHRLGRSIGRCILTYLSIKM